MATKKSAGAKRSSKKRRAGAKGTCFVVMGFGTKVDFETGRKLDLDKTYKNIIKPAVEAAGLECIRADDVIHSGPVEVPMYEELLNADVVVADLSTSNRNAYYELGVRHALKPYTTVIICEDGDKNPAFDVRNIRRLPYHHMGEGIDFDEVQRVRKKLKDTITDLLERDPRPQDSPVYTFVKNLKPPQLARAIKKVAEAAAKARPRGGSNGARGGGARGGGAKGGGGAGPQPPPTRQSGVMMYSEMIGAADEAQRKGDFTLAKRHLKALRSKMSQKAGGRKGGRKTVGGEDPYIIQRLALVTYKEAEEKDKKARKEKLKLTAKEERELKGSMLTALSEARALLETASPETSNDTETLGLWGAVHKRLWELTGNRRYLDEAVRGYERGFYLKNDYYNGINLAYLLNVRAANSKNRTEAVADFVQAERVRREVISICERWLKDNPAPGGKKVSEKAAEDYRAQKYWVVATQAEACLGAGQTAKADRIYRQAYASAPAQWMISTTESQRNKLKQLLTASPLKSVRAGRK
ncbi:MAG TPA: tetratricopeptide repeat-containing protein [Pyrinomonadaceae bacterium]|nr:tetratricopeptide repeat-containing protein [Pyrinomonadaceae bacterium]